MKVGKISPGTLIAVGLSCFLCVAGLGRAGTDWGQATACETFPVSCQTDDGVPPAPGASTSAPVASTVTTSPVCEVQPACVLGNCRVLGFRGTRVQRVEVRTVEVGCVGRARIFGRARIWNQPIRRFFHRRASIRAFRGGSICGG